MTDVEEGKNGREKENKEKELMEGNEGQGTEWINEEEKAGVKKKKGKRK